MLRHQTKAIQFVQLASFMSLGLAQIAYASGADCLIEPNQVVEVRSPIEGRIERIHVERGGFVRKGQMLFELESGVERANLEIARHRAEMTGQLITARHRLAYAAKKYARAQELVDQAFVSAQAVDEAKTERDIAESSFKDAQENQELAHLELKRASEQLQQRMAISPFDGVVVERVLNVGELAESGTGRKPVLKLAQIDPLRVEVLLPQQAYGRVAVGAKVQVSASGFSISRPATVTAVDKVIDAASGMFGVRLTLSNPKGSIPGGIRCSVSLPGTEATKNAAAR